MSGQASFTDSRLKINNKAEAQFSYLSTRETPDERQQLFKSNCFNPPQVKSDLVS